MHESASPLELHRTWAEVDLAAIRHNLGVARERLGAGVKIMAVVKANAYGHGLGRVVEALQGAADLFGVANVIEAREVRAHAPDTDVFLLGPALPHERAEIVRSGFIPSISTLAEAEAFSALAAPGRLDVHLVLDTGMGRIGAWPAEARALAAALQVLPGIVVRGLATHLPVADEDAAFTGQQLAEFHRLVDGLRAAGLAAPRIHAANSAGVLAFPAQAGDLARPGLMLYGSAPLPEWQARLRPALTWKTRITLVRDYPAGHGVSYGRTFITPSPMRIATLGAGYADGYRRSLSARGAEVLIGGRRCPVLGRVTMDQIMVDVGAVPSAAPGDEVVLLGRQRAEEIFAAELAQKAGTIAWEIFTGLGRRVVRLYV